MDDAGDVLALFERHRPTQGRRTLGIASDVDEVIAREQGVHRPGKHPAAVHDQLQVLGVSVATVVVLDILDDRQGSLLLLYPGAASSRHSTGPKARRRNGRGEVVGGGGGVRDLLPDQVAVDSLRKFRG